MKSVFLVQFWSCVVPILGGFELKFLLQVLRPYVSEQLPLCELGLIPHQNGIKATRKWAVSLH
jgi:hypothetical protein